MSQRWLHWLVRFFPDEFRRTRGDELHDAIRDHAPGGLAVVRESLSLLRAAAIAWMRFLATPTGIRHGLFMGALAWFGLLLAFGPMGRVRAYDSGALYGFYESGARTQAVIAAVLLAAAFVVVLRSRIAAATLAAVGLCLSALSIRAGDWQFVSALSYELTWLGAAFGIALLAKSHRRVRWPVAVAAALPGLLLVLGPFGRAPRMTGFWSMNQLNSPANAFRLEPYQVDHVLSSGWLQLMLAAAMFIVIVSPWVLPALAAAALPALTHVVMHEPYPAQIMLGCYLAGALWLRSRAISFLRTWHDQRLA